jgi:ZIP family zinc transporter
MSHISRLKSYSVALPEKLEHCGPETRCDWVVNKMMDWLKNLDPIWQALLATLFTWFVTALGAALVFFFKTINQRLMDFMLGFAAGVMIAASFFSLLAPAVELAEESGTPPWIPTVSGFLMGSLFLFGINKVLPHLHVDALNGKAQGLSTHWHRSILLVLAITLHNIPEGLAVGVSFGAAGAGVKAATFAGAVSLAIGIGLQNFPEGASVSVPLRREGLSRLRSFWYGQLSGVVEPIAGVAGAYAVLHIRPMLPYALSFAAGAMIFVVIEELIPESKRDRDSDTATIGAISGFAIMMLLDVALG